ncbi:hypothetical protein [Paenibacillus sp. sgz302251]|uniref:hypothetical protein n=1 Tax=Paenibacillus sp. sgz302251 TaxID=3414493 RepID=UPI003C7ED715
MQRIKLMYKLFLSEPWWFKVLVISMLLIAIIFSGSSFNGYFQSGAKLAAAIFFISYGIKFRRNTRIGIIFFLVALISLYLSFGRFREAASF